MRLATESKGDEGGGSSFAFGSAQEVGGRPYQEDGFITEANLNLKFGLPDNTCRALFAVLDGHGGDEMMEFAQEVRVCVWVGVRTTVALRVCLRGYDGRGPSMALHSGDVQ